MTISLLELKNQINSLKKGNANKDEINSIIEQYLLENQDILSKEQITKIVSEEKINPIIQKYLSEHQDVLLKEPVTKNVSEEKINPIIQKYLSEHQDFLPKEQVTKIINCESKTYSELKQMKDGKKLETGKMYLLTDFATKYEQPTSKDIKISGVEPLLLTAISNDSFEPIAYSPKYPSDIIYYDFDNDKCEDKKTSRNGFITKRIDTVNYNSTPGDFRNLLWVRYLPDEKQYYLKDKLVDYEVWSEGKVKLNVLYKSGNKVLIAKKEEVPENTEDEKVFAIVFEDITDESCALFIKDKTKIYKDIKIKIGKKVERKTFGKDCRKNDLGDNTNLYNTVLGDNCSDNTFGNSCCGNSFGNYFFQNSFGNSCNNNSFGNNCYGNDLGNDCSSNSFGNTCQINSFGNGCFDNIFGNECNNNSFGNNCSGNIFGNCCSGNNLDNRCRDNNFGNHCDNNTLKNECYSNNMGNNNDNNNFGNYCYTNSFGNSCNSNDLDNYCHGNSFGNNCNSNSFKNECYNNSFGNDCYNNSFRNNCSGNSFGNSCNNNSFGNSCDSNSFGDDCDSNGFGNNFDANSFGNNCDGNNFGNNCDSNHFKNSCDNNSFGNNCDGNKFGENTKSLFIKSLKNKDLSEIDDFINKNYTITIEYCKDDNYIAKYRNNKNREIEIINIP